MKPKYCTIILITLSFASVYGQGLDENLKLLEPFLNKKWVAKEPRFGEDAVMEWTFEIIEGGKAIRRSDTLKVVNATSVYFIIGILKSRKLVCLEYITTVTMQMAM